MREMVMSIVEYQGLTLALWLHTAKDPPQPEWHDAITRIAARKQDMSKWRSLVISDGGAPNSQQRSELAALHGSVPMKLAVITTVLANPVKRGIATAIMWFNPAMRAVGPEQSAKAFAHLDLQHAFADLLPHFARLQAELPRVATLDAVREVMRHRRGGAP
jgi:hypothetical protein